MAGHEIVAQALDAGEPTWGIEGPDFLVFYGVGFVLATVLMFLTRFAVRWSRPAPTASPLVPVQVAFLGGGTREATTLALIELVTGGSVYPANPNTVQLELPGCSLGACPALDGPSPSRNGVCRIWCRSGC